MHVDRIIDATISWLKQSLSKRRSVVETLRDETTLIIVKATREF